MARKHSSGIEPQALRAAASATDNNAVSEEAGIEDFIVALSFSRPVRRY